MYLGPVKPKPISSIPIAPPKPLPDDIGRECPHIACGLMCRWLSGWHKLKQAHEKITLEPGKILYLMPGGRIAIEPSSHSLSKTEGHSEVVSRAVREHTELALALTGYNSKLLL